MTELEEYYNKFNEDKRLRSRRGQVEFRTAMRYIHEYLDITGTGSAILDIGAATGAYSIPLADEGYVVTAVEPVMHNLGRLKAKSDKVTAIKGDARCLKKLKEQSFDVVLMFGPMYHLHSFEDKVTALLEAKRVLKKGGYLLTSYYMNDYAVIEHGFMEGSIMEDLLAAHLDEGFKIVDDANALYSYVRTEDIERLNEAAGLKRIKLVAQDGLASLLRRSLKDMSEEIFEEYVRYHFCVCERSDMLGFSAHLLDVTVS